jgi:hypothetical protein
MLLCWITATVTDVILCTVINALLSVGRALIEVYYTFTNYAWKMLSLAFASDTFGSDGHKVLQVLESTFQPLHS